MFVKIHISDNSVISVAWFVKQESHSTASGITHQNYTCPKTTHWCPVHITPIYSILQPLVGIMYALFASRFANANIYVLSRLNIFTYTFTCSDSRLYPCLYTWLYDSLISWCDEGHLCLVRDIQKSYHSRLKHGTPKCKLTNKPPGGI